MREPHFVGAAFAILAFVTYPFAVDAQWVEPPGRGWASVAVYHQNTREAYNVEGNVNPFQANGHAVSTQSFLTVALGLLQGVDAWAQFSFQRLRFDDVIGRRISSGLGDIRLYVRANPLRPLGITVPVAIRAGVKLPVGDFDVGTNVIPLGDGQRDWEVMLELGHSFYPNPTYVMGWIGYRLREEASDSRSAFGDERFFYTAVGGKIGPVGYKMALDGWYGDTPVFGGVVANGAQREMLRFSPSFLIGAGPGQIELGVRKPLAGKNLPAGTDLVIGYFTRIGS